MIPHFVGITSPFHVAVIPLSLGKEVYIQQMNSNVTFLNLDKKVKGRNGLRPLQMAVLFLFMQA